MTEPVDHPVGPYADQETPDLRSPGRYLWWLVTRQRRRVAAGALLGSSWMICLTLPPYLLSRAIDDGLRPGGRSALAGFGSRHWWVSECSTPGWPSCGTAR